MNFQLPTDDEICVAFEEGQAAILDLFHDVNRQMQELAQQLAKQGDLLQELHARLAKSSRNSSKPRMTRAFWTGSTGRRCMTIGSRTSSTTSASLPCAMRIT
jgi:hypothetical protein